MRHFHAQACVPRPLRYAREAMALLGQLIRAGRLEQRMTAQALAERAGISRALLHRIERSDPATSIGAVFEAAAVVGVPLFHRNRLDLAADLHRVRDRLTLLPQAARPARTANDAF